jgi:uncharacterized OsmC-like protein
MAYLLLQRLQPHRYRVDTASRIVAAADSGTHPAHVEDTMSSSTPTVPQAVVNGIDTSALLQTVSAIAATPALGASRFRASNVWLEGTHNRSRVTGFYGAGQEIAHAQAFTMDADEPAILAGGDKGANPVEHLLHALASCLTTSMVAHAAVRGIHIARLEAELEGDLDLRGFLGLDASVPKGYTAIRATFRASGAPEAIAALRDLAEFSPVFNTLVAGTPIDVRVEAR